MAEQIKGLDYRALPSVDWLLQTAELRALCSRFSHRAVAGLARRELTRWREHIAAGGKAPARDAVVAELVERARCLWAEQLQPVINATGVILHTNLGRAPLAAEASARLAQVAQGYCNLEFDLLAGERGSRNTLLDAVLGEVTGAEAGLAVNNNASAVLLVLTALAAGREVIVSRGQAVEIGGRFRVPDVMRQSGARLVEVGTANRTYLTDYEEAIGPETALLLRVHRSNFALTGFVHDVGLAELVDLGRRRGIPVVDDVGSGALLPTEQFGLAHEPMVQEGVAAGANIICFSGDKLLGGPQAGLLVGDEAIIAALRRHPLLRSLRLDKMALAALQATLSLYARGEAVEKVPVWRMIGAASAALGARVEQWRLALQADGIDGAVVETTAEVGGGSLPGQTLPSVALAIWSRGLPVATEGDVLPRLAAGLRIGDPPVVGRIEHERLLLDARTVLDYQDEALIMALRRAVMALGAGAFPRRGGEG